MLNSDYHTYGKRRPLEAWKYTKEITTIKDQNEGKSK